MLEKAIKIPAYLFGALLTVSGIGWLFDPAGAAEQLGMPLLDGMARSSQVGDFTAFFIVAGGSALLGLIRGNKTLLAVAAALVGGAALFRTTTFLFHDAPFATATIVLEVVMCAAFIAAMTRVGPSST